MSNFRRKIHSWLRDSADKTSSKASSKGSIRSKRSSGSNKSSSSSKSFTKLKILKEKSKTAELKSEPTFMLEKQKDKNQFRMQQIQGEITRAEARTRMYEDYSQMYVYVYCELDDVVPKCNKDGGIKINERKTLQQMLKTKNQMLSLC